MYWGYPFPYSRGTRYETTIEVTTAAVTVAQFMPKLMGFVNCQS